MSDLIRKKDEGRGCLKSSFQNENRRLLGQVAGVAERIGDYLVR